MKLVVAPFDAPGCLGRGGSRRSDPLETETRAEQSTFGAGGLRKIIHIDMDAF
jgi:hypothetical protein